MGSKTDIFTAEVLEDRSWQRRLLNGLLWACREEMFTDLTIVTRDKAFQAHKVVMVAASPYFRALLESDLCESQSNVLRLDSVGGEQFELILGYIYSGRIRLDAENATKIFTLADYFQIHDLKRLCAKYIETHLTAQSCMSVYELASLHQSLDLAKVAFQIAVKYCSQVLCQKSFLYLNATTVANLFKQPVLNIDSEDELFQALFSWVAHDGSRKECYQSLLSLLNGDQMSAEIRDVYLNQIEKPSNDSLQLDQPLIQLAKSANSRHKSEKQLLFVFGGESNGRIMGTGECFNVKDSSWWCSLPAEKKNVDLNCRHEDAVIPAMRYPRTIAASATCDNVVYLIGGRGPMSFVSSVETYHIESNRWSSLADLPSTLHGSTADFLQGKLWVVGGKSDQTDCKLDSVLVYESNLERWSFKSRLKEGRVHFGLANVNGCLIAVGGLGRKQSSDKCQEVLSSCEKYDPELDTWTPIASLHHKRAYHGVAVADNALFAIGGFDGQVWLNSVERYDFLSDVWRPVANMMDARSSFGVSVCYNRIYVMGGFSGQSVLNTVSQYNPHTNMWHCVPSMRLRRYALTATTLTKPSEQVANIE